MKTYEVTITETLEMTVEVEAKNRLEAEQIISDRWRNGDYILDAETFQGVTFRAHLPERTHER